MQKSLVLWGMISLLLVSCNVKRECGVVTSVITELPVGSDTITATIKVKFKDYEREFKVRENAQKYPYTYWEEVYKVDSRFCIENPKR